MSKDITINAIFKISKLGPRGISLEVQRLGLCTSNAGGRGWIPGQGIKIPHYAWCSQIKTKLGSLFLLPKLNFKFLRLK